MLSQAHEKNFLSGQVMPLEPKNHAKDPMATSKLPFEFKKLKQNHTEPLSSNKEVDVDKYGVEENRRRSLQAALEYVGANTVLEAIAIKEKLQSGAQHKGKNQGKTGATKKESEFWSCDECPESEGILFLKAKHTKCCFCHKSRPGFLIPKNTLCQSTTAPASEPTQPKTDPTQRKSSPAVLSAAAAVVSHGMLDAYEALSDYHKTTDDDSSDDEASLDPLDTVTPHDDSTETTQTYGTAEEHHEGGAVEKLDIEPAAAAAENLTKKSGHQSKKKRFSYSFRKSSTKLFARLHIAPNHHHHPTPAGAPIP